MNTEEEELELFWKEMQEEADRDFEEQMQEELKQNAPTLNLKGTTIASKSWGFTKKVGKNVWQGLKTTSEVVLETLADAADEYVTRLAEYEYHASHCCCCHGCENRQCEWELAQREKRDY
tara:strand:+ start:65 stop:424 length:360 start_codon:yes stop_codon:yes gene_type:complete